MQAADIVQRRTRRKAGPRGKRFIRLQFVKQQHLAAASPVVACRGLGKGLDRAEGEGRLTGRLKDIAHALALHGLHIAFAHQLADRTAQGTPRAVQLGDQRVLARQQRLGRVFAGLNFVLEDMIDLFVFCLWHNAPLYGSAPARCGQRRGRVL